MALQDDYMKTALRLPRELHEKLVSAASDSGASLNAEMVSRLAKSFESNPQGQEMLAGHIRALQNLCGIQDAVLSRISALFTEAVSLLETGAADKAAVERFVQEAEAYGKIASNIHRDTSLAKILKGMRGSD